MDGTTFVPRSAETFVEAVPWPRTRGVVVKHGPHTLTIRLERNGQFLDVSYFIEGVQDGTLRPTAHLISAVAVEPETPPTVIEIPTEQLAAIDDRLEKYKR